MHIKPIKSRYRELLETQNLCEIRWNWDVISFFEMRSKYFFTLKRNNWFVYLYAPILEFGNTITMQFLFICFIIWLLKLFVTILTYASAFIMYWHTCMKPKVRQGFFFKLWTKCYTHTCIYYMSSTSYCIKSIFTKDM